MQIVPMIFWTVSKTASRVLWKRRKAKAKNCLMKSRTEAINCGTKLRIVVRMHGKTPRPGSPNTRGLRWDMHSLQALCCMHSSAEEKINIFLQGGSFMLRWALIFFVISLLAGLFGFTGIAAGSAAIAKVLFFVAISLFLVF